MHIRKPLAIAAIAGLAVTGLGVTAGTAAAAPATGGPLATYIVQLDQATAPSIGAQRAAKLGGRIDHVYTAALKGFAVRLPSALASRLNSLPGVLSVEPDSVITMDSTQNGPDWGLDRIDQKTLPLSQTYTSTNTGAGVTAYIIDTGIETGHSDFEGRATVGFDALGGTGQDCNGHGTHVSGTVGGASYGVAKAVNLVAVRVLDCSGSGSTSGVIAGIDWVTLHHASPAVANMSLGGGVSSALDTAVSKSITSGVTYAIAAGNGNSWGIPQDACKSSPARVPAALTVAASDNKDAATSWSNYGSCVDLFAPGLNITSDWLNGGISTISGTSMATPHVTGVAALYLQTAKDTTPAAVSTAINKAATPHVVRTSSRYRTTNNNLLYTNNW